MQASPPHPSLFSATDYVVYVITIHFIICCYLDSVAPKFSTYRHCTIPPTSGTATPIMAPAVSTPHWKNS